MRPLLDRLGIGELTIRDIRAKAEQRLGSRFDIRAFHHALLADGRVDEASSP